jgi:hypothetical protein
MTKHWWLQATATESQSEFDQENAQDPKEILMMVKTLNESIP